MSITFTPHASRGEKAAQSLIWFLQALDTKIATQLVLYQRDIKFDEHGVIVKEEVLGAINLL